MQIGITQSTNPYVQSGVSLNETGDLISVANAAPKINPTAISTTLPEIRNFLNSLSMNPFFTLLSLFFICKIISQYIRNVTK